jgi:AcrR family transcriptional regulator
MFTEMTKKRRYHMRERARTLEETRRRIVEATMQLHEEIGPRATTMSAIADRAGVQRLTVYRHFPDETAVFKACTSHWLDLNPLPDQSAWEAIQDPVLRFQTAISAFYDYYSRTRRMWTAAFRDAPDVPALHEPMAEVANYLQNAAEDLIAPLGNGNVVGNVAPTVRHALQFSTWAELDGQGISNSGKVELVTGWLGLEKASTQRPRGRLKTHVQ